MPLESDKTSAPGVNPGWTDGGLFTNRAHVLHGKQLLGIQSRIYLSLELPRGAMVGLNIDHGEGIINGDPGTFIFCQVMVGMGLTDKPDFP